jgi:hypothetical protein|tara:strand:+ start:302 stop:784 length:483 start_codon:yes stop_codon:yes gene_type:complete
VIEEIKTWILDFVSVHNETIGTVPCPFAKQAMVVDKIQYTKVDAVTTASTLIDLIEWDDKYEVVVLYADTNTFTPSELSLLVKQFNLIAMKKDVVALEDHPLDEEIVNGVHMNFGKAILILVQRLSKLNNASKHLDKQGYYDNWSKENYDDVVSWRTEKP